MRDPKGESYGLGFRHALAILITYMAMTGAFIQSGVNVGVVSMASKNSSNPDFEDFGWDSFGKNAILSSFFWGLLLGSLPAGHLCQILNVKYLAIVGVGVASIMSSLVPSLARAGGWQYVSVCVAIQGFIAGVIQPCSYTFMSKWSPSKEASFLLSLANMGQVVGTAVGLPLMGMLAKGRFGWPSIFYVSTIFGLVWCVIFFIFASPSPADNKFISESEKDYIFANQKGSVSKEVRIPTPWLKILSSPAVIVLVIGETANGFGSTIIMSELPSYVDDVLKLPIEWNGFVSALPSVGLVIVLTPSAWLADYLVQKGIISETFAKKLYTFIGMGVNGALLIMVGLSGKNMVMALLLICIATACATLTISGLHTTHLSIAPNFAGVLMGLTSTGAHISGVVAPLTVAQIVKDNTAEAWTWVFVETGVVLIVGALVFCIFGSTDLQSWNSNGKEANDSKENDNSVVP